MTSKRKQTRRLQIEGLESRQLMTASVFQPEIVNLGNKPLEIGDQYFQVETVVRDAKGLGGVVEVEETLQFGTSRRYYRGFNGILWRGSPNDDRFTNESSFSATAYGGAGNDTLIGGDKVDRLHGEAGDDVIYGNGGPDTLDGGSGFDRLIGGPGVDRILARDRSGGDFIDARLGNDTVLRDPGDEVLLPTPNRVAITDATAREGEWLEFKVTVTPGDNPSSVTVDYRTEGLSAKGSGGGIVGARQSSSDYTSASQRIHFGPGGGSQTIRIRTHADQLQEPNEELRVRITRVSGGELAGNATALGTIIDVTPDAEPEHDDPSDPKEPTTPTNPQPPTAGTPKTPPNGGPSRPKNPPAEPPFLPPVNPTPSPIQLSVESVATNEGGLNEVKTVQVSVYADRVHQSNQSYRVRLTGDTTNLRLKSNYVTFEAGSNEAQLQIEVVGDNLIEVDQVAELHIHNASGTVTISNDDSILVGSKPAVFRDGVWYIDEGNGGHAARMVAFGLPGDKPLTGDFNGDGKTDLAVVRENHSTGQLDWYFDYAADGGLDKHFAYGLIGDEVAAGDFDGDGDDDAAAVRKNYITGGLDWYQDLAGDGWLAERVLRFGNIGDRPITGDFNGDGRDEMAVLRNEGQFQRWYLDTAGDGVMAEHSAIFGLIGDEALVGDWDGDGDDDFGVARRSANPHHVDLFFDLSDDGGNEERRMAYGWADDNFVGF